MNLFSVFNFIGKDDIQSFLSVSVIAYNLQPSITRIISAKKQASVSINILRGITLGIRPT